MREGPCQQGASSLVVVAKDDPRVATQAPAVVAAAVGGLSASSSSAGISLAGLSTTIVNEHEEDGDASPVGHSTSRTSSSHRDGGDHDMLPTLQNTSASPLPLVPSPPHGGGGGRGIRSCSRPSAGDTGVSR